MPWLQLPHGQNPNKSLTTPPTNIPRINQIIQPTSEPLPIRCPSNKDFPLNHKGLPHKICFLHSLDPLEMPIPTQTQTRGGISRKENPRSSLWYQCLMLTYYPLWSATKWLWWAPGRCINLSSPDGTIPMRPVPIMVVLKFYLYDCSLVKLSILNFLKLHSRQKY